SASPQHSPVIAKKAGCDILGEGDARVALDGDVIVVVHPAEVVEAEMAGQRSGFGADALHQAAITADGVNVVIEEIEARAIIAVGQPLASDRHADAGGNALAQRAGGGLDPRHPVILRMPWCLAVELADVGKTPARDGG